MKCAAYAGHGSALAAVAGRRRGGGPAARCQDRTGCHGQATRQLHRHSHDVLIPVRSAWSVDPLRPQRHQGATRVALEVEFDGAAADLAVFYIRRLVRGQVDAGFQPLAAIRAQHPDELLRRQARAGAGLPYRLQSVQLVDAVAVQLRDALPQAG